MPHPPQAGDASHSPTPRGKWLIRWLALAGSLGLLLGAITHLALMRLTGDAWWFGTVILFAPRWLLLPPLGVVALTSAVWRPRMLWINLVTLLLIVGPTMGYHVALGGANLEGNPAARVTFMTANIGGAEVDLIQREIERTEPDVVILQESTSVTAAKIFDENWHIVGGHGVCVASRFPASDPAVITADQVGRWSIPALATKLTSPAGVFWVVGVHLETPRDGFESLAVTRRGLFGAKEVASNTARRAMESRLVRTWIKQLLGPLVIAGDFNTPADSRIYGDYWSSFHNAFSERGNGFGYSKLTRWHGIRIDHLLVDDRWRVESAEVGNSIGGDHLPLIVTAVLEAAP